MATISAAAPAAAEPALWVVHGKAGSTVYLFGTIHALRPTAVWKSAKLDKAFGASQELWLEIANIDDQAAALPLVQKYGIDPTGSLSAKLDEPYRAKLAAAASSLNMPTTVLERMRPWCAQMLLEIAPLLKAGYKADSGVELVLKAAAVARKEPVKGFETVEQQIRYLAELPEAMQLSALKQTLDDVDDSVGKLDKLERAWEAGDVDSIGAALNDEMKIKSPALYEVLLVKRNQDFARQIEAKLKTPGVAFVAVGAAHLAGPDSVQAQLAKDGVRASRY